MNETAAHEPLLTENKNRFVLFPIQHDDIWQMYKKAEASFGPPKKLTFRRTLPTGRNSMTENAILFPTCLPFSPPPTEL